MWDCLQEEIAEEFATPHTVFELVALHGHEQARRIKRAQNDTIRDHNRALVKKCTLCGTPISRDRTAKAKFCKDGCQRLFLKRKWRKKEAARRIAEVHVHRKCTICGVDFSCMPKCKKLTCSKECSNIRHKLAVKVRYSV